MRKGGIDLRIAERATDNRAHIVGRRNRQP
jgi:hypothetical protein